MLDRRLAEPVAVAPDQIAGDAPGSITREPGRMRRVLDLAGIEADGIRQAAGQPGFVVGVPDFPLTNENRDVAFRHATGARRNALQNARDKPDRGPAG